MTLLLMAGTGEARPLAEALAARGKDCLVWPSGRLNGPVDWPFPVASSDLHTALTQGVTAVLDATHPFDSALSYRTAATCAARGLPYCMLWRPEWRAEPGDRWTRAATEAEAPALIPPGSTIFLATGREGLAAFAGWRDGYIYCRRIGAPEGVFPLPNGEYLIGQPPFSVAQEVALFRRLRIDWLVLRNSGSVRSVTKLTAARQLGLRILMIDRPAPPDAPRVATVAGALDWTATL